MRPTPIPNIEIWHGSQRVVFGPPNGDLDDMPAAVEALLDVVASQHHGPMRRISTRWVLEPGDLEKLQTGGALWLSTYGVLPPVSIDVKGPGE